VGKRHSRNTRKKKENRDNFACDLCFHGERLGLEWCSEMQIQVELDLHDALVYMMTLRSDTVNVLQSFLVLMQSKANIIGLFRSLLKESKRFKVGWSSNLGAPNDENERKILGLQF